VIDLEGEIQQVLPHNMTDSIDAVKPSRIASSEIYVGHNSKDSEDGTAGTFNWRDGTHTKIPGGETGNSHDLAWSHVYDDGLWVYTKEASDTIEMMNTVTGERDAFVITITDGFPDSWVSSADVNHLQLMGGDTRVVLNSRTFSAFMRTKDFEPDYTMEGVETTVEWIVGSVNGTMDLIDLDGTRYNVGTDEYNDLLDGTASLWAGQHNLEFFGEKEYMMFDNQYDDDTGVFFGPTRLLVVEVDEDEMTATLTWEYQLGYGSDIFGDNDRLPTGNMLGCAFNTDESDDDDESMFTAEIFEVVRDGAYDKTQAFSMKVWGTGNWRAYSVERLYDAPIISEKSCSDGTLSFVAYNNFKLSNHYTGGVKVTASNDAYEATIYDHMVTFSAHWRPTDVSIDVGSSCDAGCTITLSNAVGDEATEDFACSS
jgi:hypothetical protein